MLTLLVKEAVPSSMFKLGWNYFSVILKTTIPFSYKADGLITRKGTLKRKRILIIALNY